MKKINRIEYYDSNFSRRYFIKTLGIASIGLTLTGINSCTNSKKNKIGLKFYGTGTLDIQDWKRLEDELGISLTFKDNNNDPGPVISQMIMGTVSKDYDIGGLQGGAERELAAAKKIIPWDINKIPNWNSLWEWAKSIEYAKVDGKQYGLPIVINADSIIYLPEFTDNVWGREIDSYAAVFDPRFKGRTSMEDAWINSAIFTAIYLKESGQMKEIKNPGDLDKYELKEVMQFLISKKKEGQFLRFWNGWEDGLNLIKNKQVYVMTGWEPIVFAAQQAGVNAKYAVPKEGYEGWSNDLILHEGVLESKDIYEAAHSFANWELSGYYAAKLAEMRGYVVPNDSGVEFTKKNPNLFELNKQQTISDNVKNKFLKMKGNIHWQNVRPTNYYDYEEWWSKLRNA
jgi:putative spermidine/putrescine transport system substrate-binding protein